MKKMHLKNKLIAALLLLVLCISLSSCSGNMTDESARAELERLLPTSYEMNEIFWGKGLAYTEDGTNNRYMAVNEDCEYKNIEETM